MSKWIDVIRILVIMEDLAPARMMILLARVRRDGLERLAPKVMTKPDYADIVLKSKDSILKTTIFLLLSRKFSF